VMVDVRFESAFPRPLTLEELRTVPELAGMMLLKRGMRWSIQPVTELEYMVIDAMSRQPAPEGLAIAKAPGRRKPAARKIKRGTGRKAAARAVRKPAAKKKLAGKVAAKKIEKKSQKISRTRPPPRRSAKRRSR